METPICDFVREYIRRDALRLHMPGHKGVAVTGFEMPDITEIAGADSLYEADGIIAKSEENAGSLFGCKTFYSTEGSSQCIRAMLQLLTMEAKRQGRKPLIAAGRNAHKAFMTAVGLLDMEVLWLYPEGKGSYLSCDPVGPWLDAFLSRLEEKPVAVYLTSPDYLGNVADIQAAAQICHRHGVLLAVDNAHGAYLRFLPQSMHPMDLGADICCDSAHKTLPVLTGGAYLHIREGFPFGEQAKNALAIFGSTSPSYLILQSLDEANRYLETYPKKLQAFLPEVENLRQRLKAAGYSLCGGEPMKLTLQTKPYGYTGNELAEMLNNENIVCEFADPDYLVLMPTPETGLAGLRRLEQVLTAIPRKEPITRQPPVVGAGKRAMSVREAMLSPAETLPVSQCEGRIVAVPGVGCPPAVPIVVCGERIDSHARSCFAYYGIEHCTVVKE